MEKEFESRLVIDEISSWLRGELSSRMSVLESDPIQKTSDTGKVLAFLFDVLDGDYVMKWFDSGTQQMLTSSVELRPEQFRWVFGPFQSFVSRLFLVHGEKETRTFFRKLLGARAISPPLFEKSENTIGFSPAIVQTMQVASSSAAAFFDANPWAEALLASAAIVQADVRYGRMKPRAAKLAKNLEVQT